jgi:hypothetical protein
MPRRYQFYVVDTVAVKERIIENRIGLKTENQV